MTHLEELLRKVGREQLGLKDGDYFDSMVFTRQSQAVREYIKVILRECDGDVDYLIWVLGK